MGYIYKITNKINNKCYIGKTELTPEIRWKRHLNTWKKGKDRPLYRAFNKYGIDNFILEILEENDNNLLSEREIYYIELYDSFKNGYNSTKGGDGKSYLDYDLIYKTYLECGENFSETSRILKISKRDLSRKLGLYKDHTGGSRKRIPIIMYSLDSIELMRFDCKNSAAEYLREKNKNNSTYRHINKVCNGQRKTAYGYIWKFDK